MLKFHELAPSPNSVKVRLALKFKAVPFEVVEVDPSDRASVLAVSGQELTPVIEDRGIVLNDSEAILHYLDANYPDSPRLYPGDRAGRYACDGWKQTIEDRIGPHWADVFLFAIQRRDAMNDESPAAFRGELQWLEDGLASGEPRWPAHPVNELRVAMWAVYALPGDALLTRVPLHKTLQGLFGVEPGQYPQLEALLAPWQERLA